MLCGLHVQQVSPHCEQMPGCRSIRERQQPGALAHPVRDMSSHALQTCRERQDSVAAWSVIDLEEDATRSLFEFQLTRASGKVQDWQVRRSVLWPELFEMGL